MIFSDKQKEYIRERGAHRWGIKSGAVRSGKSYLDIVYTIPANIRQRINEPGLAVLMGNTKGTLQRNIITPLQENYGVRLVGDIGTDNTAHIFGEKVYCLGADNIRHVDKIRGASFKYCYGDEITTWEQAVFEMVKSRLDKPNSRFDGTCNPDNPTHWLKHFLDGQADIYQQNYTLDDNPFLPRAFVENLKREYYGTIFYNRLVLGEWVAAEGAIYRLFADNPERYLIITPPAGVIDAYIGVDFGGNGSAHSFTLTGLTRGYKDVVILDEWYHKGELTPQELETAFIDFCRQNCKRYNISEAYADNAETTLIKGLQNAAYRHSDAINGLQVYKCMKKPINDRIALEIRLFAADRLKIMRHCTHAIDAFSGALWDDKSAKDKRLDNGTTNIDSLDSFEYSIERKIPDLIELEKI